MAMTFSYDGVSSSGYIDLIIRRYRTLTPPSIVTEIKIPKSEGTFFLNRTFNKAILTIETLIKGTSENNLISKINNLKGFLHKEEPKKLIFSDENDKYINALFAITREIIDRKVWHARIDLVFHCFDPLFYKTTADEVNKTGITTKGHTWNVSNAGQYYAYPVITITFNQSQTHIYIQNNNITDSRFDISKSFTNGNVLKINSKTMRITLGDVHSPAGFGDGGDEKAEFILLRVGNNEFEVGTDDGTIDIDVKVNFNKTYL